jgi:hypothetical protein
VDEPRAAISMKLRSVAVARTISYATIAVRGPAAGRRRAAAAGEV